MQGQVYVKLIEARNCVAADKKRESDPYVEFQLIEQHSPKFKTKVFNKTLNPKWNEEFILSVQNRKVPLQFRMFSRKLLKKDTPLGTLSLDLTQLPDNILIDSWYKLQEVSSGELRLLLRFTPMMLPQNKKEHVNQRLPMFRLVLERKVYYPGETVRGTVQFNVGKPKKIRGVRVHFLGEQHTYWTERERDTFSNEWQTRVYTETITFFNDRTTLWGNKRHGDTIIIDSGTYLWPFEFTLPLNIPPTYRDSYGYTRYICRAYVDIPWKRDKEVTTSLIIHVHYASLKIEPQLYLGKKSYNKDQQINLLANLASNITYAGRPQNLHVVINNNSNKDITHMTLKMVQHITYVAEGKHKYARHQIFKVKIEDGFPVLGGQHYERDTCLNIPTNITPSMPREISPLIHLYYTLSINCNCKGLFSGSVKTKIPMTISNLPPELQNIIPPTSPTGTPGKFIIYNVTIYCPPPPVPSATMLQQEVGVFTQPQLFQSYGGESTFTKIQGDPEAFTPVPAQTIPQKQITYLPQQQPTPVQSQSSNVPINYPMTIPSSNNSLTTHSTQPTQSQQQQQQQQQQQIQVPQPVSGVSASNVQSQSTYPPPYSPSGPNVQSQPAYPSPYPNVSQQSPPYPNAPQQPPPYSTSGPNVQSQPVYPPPHPNVSQQSPPYPNAPQQPPPYSPSGPNVQSQPAYPSPYPNVSQQPPYSPSGPNVQSQPVYPFPYPNVSQQSPPYPNAPQQPPPYSPSGPNVQSQSTYPPPYPNVSQQPPPYSPSGPNVQSQPAYPPPYDAKQETVTKQMNNLSISPSQQ